MIVKLLTEHHFECLSFKGSCRGSSESIYAKISLCWKAHALAQICDTDLPTVSPAISRTTGVRHSTRIHPVTVTQNCANIRTVSNCNPINGE